MFNSIFRNKDSLGRYSHDDQADANAQMDKVLEAIKNKDSDTLKAIFSKKLISQAQGIDQSIVDSFDKVSRLHMCKLENDSLPCATKYPIVLVHGVGFRHRKHPNYWGRIPKHLQKNGAEIFYSCQDAWGSLENNALLIKNDILDVLKTTQAEKVNIIAHSNGGIESRYMIHEMDMASNVASLTTICTCHHGSKTVDRLYMFPNFLFKIAALFVNTIYRILGDKKPDFYKAFQQLTTSKCEEFNVKIKDSENVVYKSYAGKMKSAFSDWFLLIPYIVVKHIDGDNDGLVAVDSAKWGEFKGVLEGAKRRGLSHADAVDFRRHTSKSFNICQTYIDMVSELKNSGL